MASHVISVCVFCLICATHSPCGSHAAVTHQNPNIYYLEDFRNAPTIPFREKIKESGLQDNSISFSDKDSFAHNIKKRNSDNIVNIEGNINISDKLFYLKKILSLYGDGETITEDGLEKLLQNIQELQKMTKKVHEMETPNLMCTEDNSLNLNTSRLNSTSLDLSCPQILYSVVGSCFKSTHAGDKIENVHRNNTFYVVVYSVSAVVLISACGVLSLFIIPVMQKKFYKPLIQFLVALAVGTLAGDAFLHLLPHAMSGGHAHTHDEEESFDNMWKGFVAMLSLIVFFVMERFIPLIHKCRKGSSETEHHVKVLGREMDVDKSGETQCMDKYNAYGRCYKDIVNDPNTTFLDSGETSLAEAITKKNKSVNGVKDVSKIKINETKEKDTETNQHNNDLNTSSICTDGNKMVLNVDADGPQEELLSDYTVILNQHGAVTHHGHSHVHGHVHAAPKNFSSVAWMVIMGDGLHNFTDGMAIGAAFSSSLAGGFSTTVAVLCHELPHEIGDFAMLLKAGMSIKKAFFYNIISSVLCILGNLLGIWLGNTESASSWVFAVAAGTFIYIALVDMLPELSSGHKDEGNLVQCILHLSGLILGFAIMALIAFYEHDLKNIFAD